MVIVVVGIGSAKNNASRIGVLGVRRAVSIGLESGGIVAGVAAVVCDLEERGVIGVELLNLLGGLAVLIVEVGTAVVAPMIINEWGGRDERMR